MVNLPAEAGVEDAAPPKEKPGAAEFALEPNWKGCAGEGAAAGAVGAAGWLSCCCPNIKVFAGVGSEEEPWPNIKVLVAAGAGAWEEVVEVPKRLVVELEEAGVLEELAMKPNGGFGADVSEKNIVRLNQEFKVQCKSKGKKCMTTWVSPTCHTLPKSE